MVAEPLYRMTLWFDRSRLAELAADADTPGQDLLRDYLSVAMLLSRAGSSRRELLLGISG